MGVTSVSGNSAYTQTNSVISKSEEKYNNKSTAQTDSAASNVDSLEISEDAKPMSYGNEEFKSSIMQKLEEFGTRSLLDRTNVRYAVVQPLITSRETVSGADGSTFSVEKWYNYKTGETYDSNYLDTLQKKALGEEFTDFDQMYMYNITSDVLSYFSTASTFNSDKQEIESKLNDVIAEIRENIENGKENAAENLQTKITLNGVEWSFSDLMNTMDALKKACSTSTKNDSKTVNNSINLDYIDHAKMGISVSYIKKFASENLNGKQAEEANKIMQNKVNYALQRQSNLMASKQAEIEERMSKIQASSDYYKYKDNWDKRNEYYSFGGVIIATNKEVTDKIMEAFSSIGSGRSLASAISLYKELVTPAHYANGITSGVSELLDHEESYLKEYFGNVYSS